MSLRCWLGSHPHVIRDRDAAGQPCLRCTRCWRICPYPATDVAALRAEQQRQAEALAIKRQWRECTRGERT